MKETPSYDIEMTRTLDVPRERVYQAFTDPDQFAEWYGPVGFPVDRATVELDAQVGGRQRFTMASDTDPSMRSRVRRPFRRDRPERTAVEYRGVGRDSRSGRSLAVEPAGGVLRRPRQDTARRSRGPSPARNGRHGPPIVGDDAPET